MVISHCVSRGIAKLDDAARTTKISRNDKSFKQRHPNLDAPFEILEYITLLMNPNDIDSVTPELLYITFSQVQLLSEQL